MSTLEIEPERPWIRPGETFRVHICWRHPEPPERLVLRLVWATEGRGERDVGIGAREEIVASSAESAASLTLTAPEGPYSFVGRLVSLHWFLEAVVDPGDTSAQSPVVLAPTPEPIRLYRETVGR